MVKDLDKLRDELAEKFLAWPLPESVCADLCATKHGTPNRIGTNLLSFVEARAMFEYLLPFAIKHLTEAAGEFCVDVAREGSRHHQGMHGDSQFIKGARWQFEADAARIGLAEANYKILEAQLDECRRLNLECPKDCDTARLLEARLAESEHFRGVMQMDAGRAEEKLSAAEQRCKELEARVVVLEREWI